MTERQRILAFVIEAVRCFVDAPELGAQFVRENREKGRCLKQVDPEDKRSLWHFIQERSQ